MPRSRFLQRWLWPGVGGRQELGEKNVYSAMEREEANERGRVRRCGPHTKLPGLCLLAHFGLCSMPVVDLPGAWTHFLPKWGQSQIAVASEGVRLVATKGEKL